MEAQFIKQVSDLWQRYFPNGEQPIAVFYADSLHGAEYPQKPADNQRGYTCIYAQLSRIHRGVPLAFDTENLGCFGAMKSIYGGYNEDAEVKLLVEIERFKKDRDCVRAMCQVNPISHTRDLKKWSHLPTNHFLIPTFGIR